MKNVNRSRIHEDMVQLLAVKAHPETQRSLFPTIRELMCFAAMLGYAKERREPLKRSDGVEDIAIQQFEANNSTDFIYLLALAEEQNLDAVKEGREDDAVTIFEEYANGGLHIIAEWMRLNADDAHGDAACLAGLDRNGFLAGAQKEEEEARDLGDVPF